MSKEYKKALLSVLSTYVTTSDKKGIKYTDNDMTVFSFICDSIELLFTKKVLSPLELTKEIFFNSGILIPPRVLNSLAYEKKFSLQYMMPDTFAAF